MHFSNKDTKHTFLVDMGDLSIEKDNLANFIQQHLQVTVTHTSDKLKIDSEKVITVTELEHVVNKFIYHRDLNSTHWVSSEDQTVKINKFEEHHKEKAQKKEPPHQTAPQSWGL